MLVDANPIGQSAGSQTGQQLYRQVIVVRMWMGVDQIHEEGNKVIAIILSKWWGYTDVIFLLFRVKAA